MPTKFYFHRTRARVSGALPAPNSSSSVSTPTYVPGVTNGTALTPQLFNKGMDATISTVAQTSLAYASAAVTTNQQQPLLCFVSDPLAAQTIASQTITVQLGFSCSSTNSAFAWTWMLTVWRPSTGAAVGQPINGITRPLSSSAATTAEVNSSLGSAGTSTSVTAAAGDVLILEIWRNATVQSMGTSYTNTIFYDGTTEASATNNAAFLQFTNNVTLDATWVQPISCRDATVGTTSGTSFTITAPVAVVGDLIIAGLRTSATITPPTGWTRDYTVNGPSGGTFQTFSASYSVSLSFVFTASGTVIQAWACGSFYVPGGTLELDGAPVGTTNGTSNTSMPTGQPVTGSRAGDLEVLLYGWTNGSGTNTISTVASGSSILNSVSNGGAPNTQAAIGYNQTNPLAASTTPTAFNQTISAALNDKVGVGVLLRQVVTILMPNTALAGPVDAFN